MCNETVSTGPIRAAIAEDMLVLALDTANDRTAVALTDGRRIDVSHVEAMERGHAERLMPMIEAVVREAGVPLDAIERIAVTVGPGSFTGIRVALAAARGLGLALSRPVIGVDSLSALAASLPEPATGPVLAVIDARRGELYAALFSKSGAMLIEPFAGDVADIVERAGAFDVVVGSGTPIVGHYLATAGQRVPTLVPLAGPDPRRIAQIGREAAPTLRPPSPLYLRAPDAKPQAPVPGLLE
jgi:tRNA threonylcarbamoyladenosine biosynthesis protein TsaB